MKKRGSFIAIAIALSVMFIVAGCGSPTTSPEAPPEQEGVLSVSNVYQYLGYNPEKIATKMDGKLEELDLYYDIVDESVCSITDGYVTGLKVGSTGVYAQTIGGQEVEFTVTVRDPAEFAYNAVVLSHEQKFPVAVQNHTVTEEGMTLFVGDSFFDTQNFWHSFNEDWYGKNCFSVGVSSSQTTDWMIMRNRLINRFKPKNIVMHIGTNDINATMRPTVQSYYDVITKFISTVIAENPTAEIYYLGIENRNGDQAGRNDYSFAVTEKIRQEFAPQYGTFHYIDSPAVFNAAPDTYVAADNIHPSGTGYKYYVDTLTPMIDFGV